MVLEPKSPSQSHHTQHNAHKFDVRHEPEGHTGKVDCLLVVKGEDRKCTLSFPLATTLYCPPTLLIFILLINVQSSTIEY